MCVYIFACVYILALKVNKTSLCIKACKTLKYLYTLKHQNNLHK